MIHQTALVPTYTTAPNSRINHPLFILSTHITYFFLTFILLFMLVLRNYDPMNTTGKIARLPPTFLSQDQDGTPGFSDKMSFWFSIRYLVLAKKVMAEAENGDLDKQEPPCIGIAANSHISAAPTTVPPASACSVNASNSSKTRPTKKGKPGRQSQSPPNPRPLTPS